MSSEAIGCHRPLLEGGHEKLLHGLYKDVHVEDFHGLHFWLSATASHAMLVRLVEAHNDVARGEAADDAETVIELDLIQPSEQWLHRFQPRPIPLRRLQVRVRGQCGEELAPYDRDVPYPWNFTAGVQGDLATIRVSMLGTRMLAQAILDGWMLWCDDHWTHAASIMGDVPVENLPKNMREGERVWFWLLDREDLALATKR